jgi:hypothetical protein
MLTVGSLYSHAPGLHVELLAVLQLHREDVAVAVQPHERVAVGGAELVDEDAAAAAQHVADALHTLEGVVEVVGGGEELVLAHVHAIAVAQVQRHALPGRPIRRSASARRRCSRRRSCV